MEQPEKYFSNGKKTLRVVPCKTLHQGKVCKLVKSLYDLK